MQSTQRVHSWIVLDLKIIGNWSGVKRIHRLGTRGKPSTIVYRAGWLVEPFFPNNMLNARQPFLQVTFYLYRKCKKTWTRIRENPDKQRKISNFRHFFELIFDVRKSFLYTRKHSRTLSTHPRSFLEATRPLSRKLKISWKSRLFRVMKKSFHG